MRSRELDRARHIRDCLKKIEAPMLKKYADRLRGAPAEVMDNGLLQSLAFFRSKKDREYQEMASHLEEWLRSNNLVKAQGGELVLEALVALDPVQYRRCSEEALAWLNWAKRLALAKVMMAGG